MIPLGLLGYRMATAALEPAAPLLLRRRAGRGKEDPVRMRERLGYASQPRPPGPLIWLHGASVGESLSLTPLADALQRRRPGLTILVTSGTVTAASILVNRLNASVIHQYVPIDTPRAADRFATHWRPDLAVFVESEIWPNLLERLRQGGSATALLSARLSEASLNGWSKAPVTARRLFGGFNLAMAQDDTTAARLVKLGARDDGRLNLKRLGAAPPVDAAALAALRSAAGECPVLLAASTHPGEDEIVLAAFNPLAARPDKPILVIAPRHPDRGGDIMRLAEAGGLAAGLQSAGSPFGAHPVHVADTLGEMGLWFSLARTTFVGGSLLPGPGGHNPVEPARLGCPIITGPHVENWKDLYADLAAIDGLLSVRNETDLAQALVEALDDAGVARRRAEHATAVVADGGEALHDAARRLLELRR